MHWPSRLVARRGRVRLRGVRTLKATGACVAAYLAAVPLSDNARPVLAPLTALLVVQLTLYDTVRRGMLRVVSVVLGVLVAAVLSTVVPLTWWSLGIVIAVSLVIGRLLRLGDEIAEVPISAMLVLAVGGSGTAAEGRVAETVIGAVVGVLAGAVVAPPLYVRPASDAVQDVARGVADVMRQVSREVRGEYGVEQADAWLAAARGLGRDVLRADGALGTAEASLRYNPRARSRPHAGVSLRSGLDGIERASVSLRGVCRALADLVRGPGEERTYGADVREALSDLLADVADAVEAYGVLVGSEVVGPGPEDLRLREALSAAWADRHRFAGLLRHEDRMRRDEWQLHGALTTHIDQLLRDVDSEARAELRRGWPQREHGLPTALSHAVKTARDRIRRPS
ncbi:MAG: FUSC family protein [Sporichthyaceae bacterium]